MDNEVIENIYYITTMVECELDESSRLIVKNTSLSFRTSFCTSTFYFKINSLLECTHYKKINTFPLCIVYMPMPQILPLFTFMLVRMWYEESTPWGILSVLVAGACDYIHVSLHVV